MSKAKVSLDDILSAIESLPYKDFKKVIDKYSAATGKDTKRDIDAITAVSLERRLQALGVNSVCPKCGSKNIVKDGKRNHIQCYKCKDCSSKFTVFTDTILEKTKWHWDIWIKVLEMTINNYPVHKMINVLEKDYGCEGINYKTVWLWRMKLIHAMASMPKPLLSGVIQIDETFIRESQKGSRSLQSTVKGEDRQPRYGRKPSKYGVMGPEFATVVAAVDDRGYCVCLVSSLGKVNVEQFTDLFDEYIKSPAYLCSDANDIYEQYCELKGIPHYERPSNYITIIEKNGYKYAYPGEADYEDKMEQNRKLLAKLYKKGLIDRITNQWFPDYEDFEKVKKEKGLSLGRVNELHADIKRFIYSDKTNVSTKYLPEYIGYFTYIRNWRIEHGHYPSSKADTLTIFEELLKAKSNFTIKDVMEREVEIPAPSGRYMSLLKEETEKARKATRNRYFKFNEEDRVVSFNKREYLLNLPKSKLYEIAKEVGLTRFKRLSTWSIATMIIEAKDSDKAIYKALENDRTSKIDEEDLAAIRDGKYRMK